MKILLLLLLLHHRHHSPLSQSNESFGIGDFDNQSSFPSSTTQSSIRIMPLQTFSIRNSGPLLGLLMNENTSFHHRHHSPLSHNLTNPLVSVTLIINPHSRLRPPNPQILIMPLQTFSIRSVPYLAF